MRYGRGRGGAWGLVDGACTRGRRGEGVMLIFGRLVMRVRMWMPCT